MQKKAVVVKTRKTVSGDYVELFQYYVPYLLGGSSKNGSSSGKLKSEQKIFEERILSERLSARRAKNQLERLILCNIGQYHTSDKFLTVTFAENIQDREIANYLFMKFIQRLRYHFGTFEYLAVPELQNRGAIHYHILLFGLPFISKDHLADIWKHGYIKINAVERYYNLAHYIAKYINKDFETGRKKAQKRYMSSRGLKKPIIEYNIDLEVEKQNGIILYEDTFDTEHAGVIRLIKLKREPTHQIVNSQKHEKI
ncbi:rolling circle replication-associated protein [Culicoidibacter larvae]|nr:hypothetical protein [Culicoidibacter larvae]